MTNKAKLMSIGMQMGHVINGIGNYDKYPWEIMNEEYGLCSETEPSVLIERYKELMDDYSADIGFDECVRFRLEVWRETDKDTVDEPTFYLVDLGDSDDELSFVADTSQEVVELMSTILEDSPVMLNSITKYELVHTMPVRETLGDGIDPDSDLKDEAV